MRQVDRGTAINRKFPESVVFIVTPESEGTPNVMPAGWSMFTSGDPLMLAVSVGLSRHTHTLLEAADDYVIAFPSAAQKEDIVFCGSNSGANVDKVEAADMELAEPAEVSTPLLAEATACFECLPAGSFRTGDHTIFVGEVVATHASDEYTERVKNLGREWGDGPERFWTLSELLEYDGASSEIPSEAD